MSFWTDERIEALRTGIHDGLTAREIAEQFGCTKNAVIRKAMRLGLMGRNVRQFVWVVGYQGEGVCFHRNKMKALRKGLRMLNVQHGPRAAFYDGEPRYRKSEVEAMLQRIPMTKLRYWEFA